jgi:cysteine synthase A
MLTLLGAELMLTPATDAMKDAIASAEEIARTTRDTVIRQQFKNPRTPEIHAHHGRGVEGYGREGDIFVTRVGTDARA